jgi:hypothetical protein
MATCRSSDKTKSAVLNHISALTRFSFWAITIVALSGMARAQSKLLPGIEVFGGYSHLTVPTNEFGFGSRTEMNGFHVALSIPHIVKGLGVVAETTGDYSSPLEQYNYAVGPQYKFEFNRFRFIAHGMYGKAQTRVRNIGSTFVEPSDRQRALIFGGQVDIPIKSRWQFRIVQGDYVRTSAFGNTLSEIRVSTGLVYSFGKH